MERKRLGKVGLLQVFFVLAIICQANALPVDVNIYSDTTIITGDEYGTVNIYDTPPDQTIVDMTGGDILYCNIYDTANLNCSGGDPGFLYIFDYAKAYISTDAAETFEIYNFGQAHVSNGPVGASIFIYDNAQLHIYGFDLEYDETPAPDWITGQWENGQGFKLILRNINGYNPNQVFLHEIPEPVSIMLFAFGGLLLRRTRM